MGLNVSSHPAAASSAATTRARDEARLVTMPATIPPASSGRRTPDARRARTGAYRHTPGTPGCRTWGVSRARAEHRPDLRDDSRAIARRRGRPGESGGEEGARSHADTGDSTALPHRIS